MSYEKHVWGGGVPNRNKLIDMDEGIEALDSNKMDKPSNTGTIGQVLKKTATGSEWSNGGGGGSTAGDITYDSTATYADGTVGKELKEQSENIMNLGITPDAYDSSLTYNVNALCTYNGNQYQCNTDGTTGDWDNTKWTLLTSPKRQIDYSTTEQKTGRKWIDGRDIWEKTFEINSGFVAGNNSFNHNISNFDKSIKLWGHLVETDNTVKSIPLVQVVNNNFDAYWSTTNLAANSTELLLYIGGGTSVQTDKVFITMQYIKSV